MRAVVLAAGEGGRLEHLTAALPKPLVPLDGRAIIDYTLEALVEAGITEALVVTGYRETQVRAALSEGRPGLSLGFVSNNRYHGPASLSLRAARRYAGDEPFLLVMADHVLSCDIIRALCAAHAARPGVSYVAADCSERAPDYAAEATKIELCNGAVVRIGKGLPKWDALDAGAFLLVPAAWDAVDAVPESCELSIIFAELARRGALFAADISGAFWYDIDTSEDLAAAAALLLEPREV